MHYGAKMQPVLPKILNVLILRNHKIAFLLLPLLTGWSGKRDTVNYRGILIGVTLLHLALLDSECNVEENDTKIIHFC